MRVVCEQFTRRNLLWRKLHYPMRKLLLCVAKLLNVLWFFEILRALLCAHISFHCFRWIWTNNYTQQIFHSLCICENNSAWGNLASMTMHGSMWGRKKLFAKPIYIFVYELSITWNEMLIMWNGNATLYSPLSLHFFISKSIYSFSREIPTEKKLNKSALSLLSDKTYVKV